MPHIDDLYNELLTLEAKVAEVKGKINDERKRSLMNIIALAENVQNEISELAMESGICEEFVIQHMMKVLNGNFCEEEFFNAKELKW